MHEFFPLIIIGAIIGFFSIVFLIAYLRVKGKKDDDEFERRMSDGEIIRRLMQEDERIRLFVNEKNQGLASVRNQGILRASGEYIYFLDSDDMIRQDALLSLYSKAEEEEKERR